MNIVDAPVLQQKKQQNNIGKHKVWFLEFHDLCNWPKETCLEVVVVDRIPPRKTSSSWWRGLHDGWGIWAHPLCSWPRLDLQISCAFLIFMATRDVNHSKSCLFSCRWFQFGESYNGGDGTISYNLEIGPTTVVQIGVNEYYLISPPANHHYCSWSREIRWSPRKGYIQPNLDKLSTSTVLAGFHAIWMVTKEI